MGECTVFKPTGPFRPKRVGLKVVHAAHQDCALGYLHPRVKVNPRTLFRILVRLCPQCNNPYLNTFILSMIQNPLVTGV